MKTPQEKVIPNKAIAIGLLRHARKLVDAGEQYGICDALWAVYRRDYRNADNKTPYLETVMALVSLISRNLKGHLYYVSWLAAHSKAYRALDEQEKIAAACAGRLAWIDWMISELEALLPPEGEKHFPHSRSSK